MSYKVIYCAIIEDEKHAGLIKIGDTDYQPTKALTSYAANDPELVKTAEKRIAEWSGTAAAGAICIYCDILLRFNNVTQNHETYRDYEIHSLVQSVGGYRVDFDSKLDSGREWFKTDLETVVAAIKATKEGRDYLDTSELPEKVIYDLREEQKQAVDKTFKRFEKAGDMLWHAKMRFGKTITALNLVKKEGYKRTIIITHRPVVEDSWGTDFYHVFSKDDRFAFLTKIHDGNQSFSDDTTDEAIDKANEDRLRRLLDLDVNIVYFASIQDLRGSKVVGGKFEKNKIVFETEWDFVIIDEAHEGTKTELGQAVISTLIKPGTKKLDLSGTAYNLLDKYTDDKSIFTWDYVMEQDRKKHWPDSHPGEPNPYADMPVMHINTFSLETAMREKGFTVSDKSFSFREFFRTWTGDLSKDRTEIPEGYQIGDFVHADHVKAFLDLLSKDSTRSRFPYATEDGCNQNIHTLWMVPGVKEAAALSKMLKEHTFFMNFGIANVAGEGDHDEEKNYSNALEYVRKKIESNPCTITLSCGRLTTGVTVKEWSSVFMLAGSDETDAKQYMQTIFRVQSAGKINGVQKTDCYVYDFAPDRALTVVAETAGTRNSGRGGTIIRDDEQHSAFEEFLGYCPIVAIDGAEFKPFSVQDLVSQINRVHIGRALRTGFMDNCIYDTSKFKSLSEDDLDKLNDIFKKLKETKQKGPLKKAGMANTGLGKGKKGKTAGESKGKDELDRRQEEVEQKRLEKELLERLRTISIRIPLLFFGGEFEIEEGRLADILTGIDDASWKVFMPSQLTKNDFRELVQYYNQETVIGAGKAIREKAKAADLLAPTERTIAIAEIFSHFQNPSHETVLTPWRIVNMHMALTLGGYCFYNKEFEENDDEYYRRLQEPRYVAVDGVTEKTLGNPDACILEINSKSGLYPLFVAYSLYRAKLQEIGKSEADCLPEKLRKVWNDAVSQVYVVCQSPMSVLITKRTLCGYDTGCPNLMSEENLVNTLKNTPEMFTKRIIKADYWKKGAVGKMKFEAVVGNPPYQEEAVVKKPSANGQIPRKNIFHYFQLGADSVTSGFVSLIYPGGRWIHRSGKGLLEFGKVQINDIHLSKIDFFPNAEEIFRDVAIADGISIVFKDMSKTEAGFDYVYHDASDVETIHMDCPGDELIPLNPHDEVIIQKVDAFVKEHGICYMATRILPRSLFGIESSFVEQNPDKVREYQEGDSFDSDSEIKLFTNDKAGKAGRARWYVADRSVIKTGTEYIDRWKVIVSSANAGGQKRDNQISIADNHSAFGRTRVALGAFLTEREAINFFNYCNTKLIRFMFLMTDESLTSLGKKVPDILNYTDDNGMVNFADDLDSQLFTLVGLNPEEIAYIEEALTVKAGGEQDDDDD